MRKLAAITSLCSLSFLLSCDKIRDSTPAPPASADGGSDGQPLDLPSGQDGISGGQDGSPESISTGPGFDGALDGVDAAGDGAGDGLDSGDASRDAPASSEAATDASAQESAPDGADDAGEGDEDDASETDAPILDGTCAIRGRPARVGTVCRVAAGLCDVVEVCDGLSMACPFDAFRDKDEVCRSKAGECDHEETCTGFSAACPADTFLSKGAVCRSAVSTCDVAETCDGASAVCPLDVVAPATTQCRASSDQDICDPPEYCTGRSNQCPADAKYSPPAAAPTGVAVTPGALLADVSWSPITGDAGAGITGYNVKSSTLSTGGFTIRGSPPTFPFTVTPIEAGLAYYFVVSTYSGQPSCQSPNSSPPVSALSCVATAPTSLIATPDGAGHVALTWTPPSGSVASYSVSRSTTSGSGYTIVPGAGALATASFTDSPVVLKGATVTFYYVARAFTGTCLSPYSAPATAVISSPGADAGADAAADAAADTAAD
jgi:hypothetical protein